MNRRSFLASALALLAARGFPLPAWINNAEAREGAGDWRHGVSPFGELKYPSGFKNFDYVNTSAPKGGSAWQIALGSYDSFNMVVAGIKGTPAAGLELIYDTLMVPSLDEAASEYGLLAEAVSYPATFRPRCSGYAQKRNGTTASLSRPKTSFFPSMHLRN